MTEDEAKELVLSEWIDHKSAWWRTFWSMMCMVVLNYKDGQLVTPFFSSLYYIIPCNECSEHYKDNFSKLYPTFWINKSSLQDFIKNVYNNIELESWRNNDRTWERIRDKYIWDNIITQCNIYINT